MLLGIDLKEWRRRNGFTQEKLRMALGTSRQTIIAWEQSDQPLATAVELALLALEYLPERCLKVSGKGYTPSDYREVRSAGPQLYNRDSKLVS